MTPTWGRAAPAVGARVGVIRAFPALLVMLIGCAGPPASQNGAADSAGASNTIPAEEPSIRGTITAADDRSIRVEENPADESGSAKALVRLSPAVPILSADGSRAALNDLRVGVSVSVWFTGPVAESYPVQASAGAIRIDRSSGSERP